MKPATPDRAEQLAYRRARLRAQCDIQRRQLAQVAADIERELNGIDRVVLLMRRVASKPVLVSAAVALLSLLGPGRALRWVSQGAFWYGAGRKLVGAVAAHPQLAAGLRKLARDGVTKVTE
jgi:hypothetical protein